MTKLQSDQLLVPEISMEGISIAHVQWSDALEKDLYPEERKIIPASWSKKRKAQFILGRVAAHEAYKALSAESGPILRSSDDAPVWPQGMLGSIAHCEDVGVAAAAKGGIFEGLGIDLELISDRPLKVLSRIANDNEEKYIKDSSEPEKNALILFSVKESIYKALAPILKRYIGFHEVEIQFNSKKGSALSITPQGKLTEDLQGMSLEACAAFSSTAILSLAWVKK